jgi:hypothetical protein
LNNSITATKKSITVTEQFTQAFYTLEHTDTNLFVTGKAGTGKSTFLEYFRKKTAKKAAVVAPTGVSALNVRGQTIHSFFGFKPAFLAPGSVKAKIDPKKIFSEIEILIIDEISMVRADVFEAIEHFLRLNGPHKGVAFGGVQICVIGDLFQLPPIVSRDEEELFEQFFRSPFFFGCPAYHTAEFKTVELDHIFRQSEQAFIDNLNRLRLGENGHDIISFLNQRHTSEDVLDDSVPVTLTTTNRIADDLNQQKLAALSHTPYRYHGKIEGEFDKNSNRLPAPLDLELKENAQVMFVRNDQKKRWVNGTIGTVKRLTGTSIDVAILKNGRARTYTLEKEEWESIQYDYDEETDAIKIKTTGSYTQYPLTLAWAITIHKSQGKTLDSAVIDLGRGAFASGQLYVALSRCRSFENIVLKKPITYRDIKCDNRVVKFYDYILNH